MRRGSGDKKGWSEQLTIVGLLNAQFGTRVPSGTGSGKLRDGLRSETGGENVRFTFLVLQRRCS